jgi:hypothetical protein
LFVHEGDHSFHENTLNGPSDSEEESARPAFGSSTFGAFQQSQFSNSGQNAAISPRKRKLNEATGSTAVAQGFVLDDAQNKGAMYSDIAKKLMVSMQGYHC